MTKRGDAKMKPSLSILGEKRKGTTSYRYRVDIGTTSIYVTYTELIILAMLGIHRKENIDDGWVHLDSIGCGYNAVRGHLYRLAKQIRAKPGLKRWGVYESDNHCRIRLLTAPGKIDLNLDRLAELGDFRLEELL